jgi:hypothetical protein
VDGTTSTATGSRACSHHGVRLAMRERLEQGRIASIARERRDK